MTLAPSRNWQGKVAGVVEAQEGTVDVDDGLDNTTQSYDSCRQGKGSGIRHDNSAGIPAGLCKIGVPDRGDGDLCRRAGLRGVCKGEEQANVTLDDIKNLTFSYEDKMAQLSGTGSDEEKETDEKLSEDTKDTGDAKDIEDTEDTGDTGDTVK